MKRATIPTTNLTLRQINNFCALTGCNFNAKDEEIVLMEIKTIFVGVSFGSPNQKIGDFVQSKLNGWSQ